MYIYLAIILLCVAIFEFFYKLPQMSTIRGLWFLLTAMLCLRYGQGTDYFHYELQFMSVDSSGEILKSSLYHGEIGWYIILLLAKRINMSFPLLIGLLSLVEMLLIKRYIEKSPYKATSFLLLLPTYYMTYCYSAIRQGIVMAFFLGIGLDLLYRKKYLYYFLLIIFLSIIHMSAFILIILPFLSSTQKNSFSVIGIPVIALSVYLSFLMGREYIAQFSFSSYIRDSASIGGLLIRLVMALLIIFIRQQCTVRSDFSEMLYRYYLIGFSIFLAFSFTGTFSQRLTMPFKAIEVILIPLLLYQCRSRIVHKAKVDVTISFFFVAFLMGVEYLKNIDSYIDQGGYYSDINVINYPYVSVFDKTEISQYRDIYYNLDSLE